MTKGLAPLRPGRGAWSLRGGLLPIEGFGSGSMGYYRRHDPSRGEEVIGAASLRPGADFDARVVHYGVRAIQDAIGVEPVTGLYDPGTADAVLAAQRRQGGTRTALDGTVGPVTARVIFGPLVAQAARAHGVPADLLGGLLRHESGLDPAYVSLNGIEVGIGSIDLSIHPEIKAIDACNARFAVDWIAGRLKASASGYESQSPMDPWVLAIASRNSRELANRWAVTGTPPFSVERMEYGLPQIGDYVQAVIRLGAAFL